jgi:hypothetical protein
MGKVWEMKILNEDGTEEETVGVWDHDPISPIRQVYEQYHGSAMPRWRQTEKENDLWDAVKRSMEGGGRIKTRG